MLRGSDFLLKHLLTDSTASPCGG